MSISLGSYIKQLKDILDEYEIIKKKAIDKSYKPIKTKTIYRTEATTGPPRINSDDYNRLIIKAKAAIRRIAGMESEYYNGIKKLTKKDSTFFEETFNFNNLERIMGVVKALFDDLNKGYLNELVEIVHAELFADLLEQAKYLLNEGYKDAAAVISGSILEQHFRKLCSKNNLELNKTKNERSIPKSMDELKQDLAREKIISSNDINLVTGWIQIRNKAAHGHYDTYNLKDIELMIQGIGHIVSKYPA